MKCLYTFLFTILVTHGLTAQVRSPKDVLFLRDGSILMGEIIGTHILDHEFILYATSDTLRISNLAILRKRINVEDRAYYSKGKYHFLHGYTAQLSMGFDLSNISVAPHLSVAFNKRINQKYSAGLGVTYFEIISNKQFTFHRYLSVHLMGRKYLTSIQRPARFYLKSKLGYSLPLPTFQESFRRKSFGGLYALLGVGMHLPSRGKLKFSLEYDYMAQRFKTRQQFIGGNPPGMPGIITTKGFFLRHLFTIKLEIK